MVQVIHCSHAGNYPIIQHEKWNKSEPVLEFSEDTQNQNNPFLQNPNHILEAAYNDSAGVTADFNLNDLDHLNSRFDGNFDRNKFEHWTFYNETKHQIETYLRSLETQTAELSALNLKLSFEAGETIHTEISRKFDIDEIQQLLGSKGLVTQKVWTDENQWFSLVLS